MDPGRDDAVAAARAAIARGDLIEAYDLAGRALAAAPGSDAAYLRVLALARMGDTEAAMARYEALDLGSAPGTDPPALAARLLKDRAFATRGPGFREAIAAAAAAYAAIFARTRDPFPGINAATLAEIGGDAATAARLAGEVLALLPAADTDVWGAATRAEALLLAGDAAAAEAALARGLALPGADAGARSSTARQFARLADHAGLDGDGRLRALLAPPSVAFWCGHVFRADAGAEAAVAGEVRRLAAERRIGSGYGALAAGADLVIAETLLGLGAEIHVVLPFAVEDFKALSVRPAGPEWEARFDAVLARASSLRLASTVPDLGDPRALGHGSRVAMGLARLRARHLGSDAVQLAVWDGGEAWGVAGTAVDVAAWRRGGGKTLVIPPGEVDRNYDRSLGTAEYAGPERATMAIVFADVVGFSRLGERDFPQFWREVMGRVGARLDAAGALVESRNSWGDALYAVIAATPAAARLVLDLQAEIGAVHIGEGADAVRAGLRIGVHYGTIYRDADPITGRPNFYGTEVNRAARIEPITPPGAAYVTESFAAALAIDAPDEFDCFYVGQVPLAKAYGTFPMYRLTRR